MSISETSIVGRKFILPAMYPATVVAQGYAHSDGGYGFFISDASWYKEGERIVYALGHESKKIHVYRLQAVLDVLN